DDTGLQLRAELLRVGLDRLKRRRAPAKQSAVCRLCADSSQLALTQAAAASRASAESPAKSELSDTWRYSADRAGNRLDSFVRSRSSPRADRSLAGFGCRPRPERERPSRGGPGTNV